MDEFHLTAQYVLKEFESKVQLVDVKDKAFSWMLCNDCSHGQLFGNCCGPLGLGEAPPLTPSTRH